MSDTPEPIEIVFDGPPSHTSGRFVEVEQGGKGIKYGEWIDRGDGFWALRLPTPTPPHPPADAVPYYDLCCTTDGPVRPAADAEALAGRLDASVQAEWDKYRSSQDFTRGVSWNRVAALARALVAEGVGLETDNLGQMQRHRDDWRQYAYGRGPRPQDFLDGNMVEGDRGPTVVDQHRTLRDKVREITKLSAMDFAILVSKMRERPIIATRVEVKAIMRGAADILEKLATLREALEKGEG